MNWVYNTATNEWGITTASGGFIAVPGVVGPYSGGPTVHIPPGGSDESTPQLGEAVTVDDILAESTPPLWEGIDPMGAGIAGVNTPGRKLGQGNNPGQQTTTSGGIEVTKAQKRDARNIRNEFDLNYPT